MTLWHMIIVAIVVVLVFSGMGDSFIYPSHVIKSTTKPAARNSTRDKRPHQVIFQVGIIVLVLALAVLAVAIFWRS